MSLIYTSVEQKYNKIFFRGYKDGKRVQTDDAKFEPSLFVPSGSDDAEYKSLYSVPLKEIKFDSISEAKNYIKSYKDVMDIHGNERFEYDFIHRNFSEEQHVTIDDLSVIAIDIETKVEHAFPNVKTAEEEVLLISNYCFKSKKMTTFGCRPYTGSDTNYVLCLNEADLLSKWINYCIDVDFDIMTGWNVIQFDMAYLGTRIIKTLGQKALDRLSPFGRVESRTETIMDREILKYEIAGRTVLDMLELYKKFRFINRPSYKLSYVSQVELGDDKTENPYKSFKEHYTVGWNDSEGKQDGFVRYNIQDVNLLVKLEEKLGMVYLAVTLAYLTKVNYSDVYSPVKTWESYILSTLYEEKTLCALKKHHSSDHQIMGGYVKEPVPGLYRWTGVLDATSLYPSFIMSLNMSPETFVDVVDGISIDTLLNTDIVNESEYALAANGSRYRRDTRGVMARLTESMFAKRKSAKDEMLRLKREYEQTHDESFKKTSARFGVLQLAVKTQLNSLFGALANKYFLFFDNRIAEGITSTGQYAIQEVSRSANKYMSKICKKEMDYVVYNDTDSLCVCFDDLVNLSTKKMTDDATVDYILKFINNFLGKELNKTTKEISTRLNFYENKLYFKPEAISSATVVLAKKRNCQRVLDNEGVRYAEPEYKITGIETNRSSTPDLVREWLTEAIRIVLDHTERSMLIDYIEKRRNDFKTYSVEEISFPRGVNNMREYSHPTMIYSKGCPIAVRAALLYNNLVKKKGLENSYELIKEGDKIKYVALIEPNTLREDIIGFPFEIPKEFGLHKYVDYNTQFKKAFLDPLIKIMDALKWKLEEENSLDDFFG